MGSYTAKSTQRCDPPQGIALTLPLPSGGTQKGRAKFAFGLSVYVASVSCSPRGSRAFLEWEPS